MLRPSRFSNKDKNVIVVFHVLLFLLFFVFVFVFVGDEQTICEYMIWRMKISIIPMLSCPVKYSKDFNHHHHHQNQNLRNRFNTILSNVTRIQLALQFFFCFSFTLNLFANVNRTCLITLCIMKDSQQQQKINNNHNKEMVTSGMKMQKVRSFFIVTCLLSVCCNAH